MPIHVATWNVWWRFGDWIARRPAIVETLRRADPDILCLQEAWAVQGSTIADDLGFTHRLWAPSPRSQRWQRRLGDASIEIGELILSRWPITASAIAELPEHPEDEGRIAALAQIETPQGPVIAVTTHLASPAHLSELRCTQVEAIWHFLAEHDSLERNCLFLTGDFNAEPDSDEIRKLCGHKTAPVINGRILLDAWLWAAPDLGVGNTWSRENGHIAVTGSPSARIDYLFVEATTGIRVTEVSRLGDQPIDGVWASDHFGVQMNLTIPGAR
ncbi:MAG: endonuclease/exonuclease/phosphatase family protein [Actinomycetota bacterium]|nr:endonuclease/exonuclease/phosphatase family protein [Actinomycetota bacterium]